MKSLTSTFQLILFVAALAFFSELTQAKNSDSKSTDLNDIASYNYDKTKIEEAPNAFHFYRSFVDLFYRVVIANPAALPTITSNLKTTGWCVGDAHAENFGTLLQANGQPIFTMNDMDDSGPCPLMLDLTRFMVGSRLYDSEIDLVELSKAYRKGLNGKLYSDNPGLVDKMLEKSKEKGFEPKSKKVDLVEERLIREALDVAIEVSSEVRAQILAVLTNAYKGLSIPSFEIKDIVQTSKTGGGSGGLLRYEVLLKVKSMGLVHVELKEEVQPAIAVIPRSILPTTTDRIHKAIEMAQTTFPSPFYSVVSINGKDMLIRPRFSGDKGFSLDDNDTIAKNEEVIYFEAFILGQIHSRSLSKGSIETWQAQVEQLQKDDASATHIEDEIGQLTNFFFKKAKDFGIPKH